ncbi:MAG: cysteine hydrolase [Deltaproteobacteria bacterium]|nr:MAG: cysteine hydrolase [Deltaproteobacteria bacterium]
MTELDATRVAVLSMDFQVEILRGQALGPSDAEARARLDAAVEGAARALAWARRVGAKVVHVRHAHSEGYPEGSPHVPMTRFMKAKGVLQLGQPGTAFDDRVAPVGDELVVTKHTISALAATPLERQLRVWGVDTVLLAGVVTHFVIDGTARQAVDLGFRTLVLTDACASADPVQHDATLKNLGFLGELITTADLS